MPEIPPGLAAAQHAMRLLHTTTAPVVYITGSVTNAHRHARAAGIPRHRVRTAHRACHLRGARGPLVVIELHSAQRLRPADRDEIRQHVDLLRATGADVVHLVEDSPEERAVGQVLAAQLAAAHPTTA
ncbi:hypothetical protein ACOQFV_27375 [Nocardiopsis changdeensis]|uniref:Uncharacterized protein n=1 Tax=Nocardiopsis changdeensis TaxID=2831969 RepID=A0ABX8BMR5_9ACTN|nr:MULTISPECIES: hypothetical protein [Nocardiopsis]QUX22990.1 hypothetical protein KGD84_00835 [Nocardiopsis changdeensis]QYX38933.1 hypothetical protein K1J57_10285 [Nocardiopsis sp. MT53]